MFLQPLWKACYSDTWRVAQNETVYWCATWVFPALTEGLAPLLGGESDNIQLEESSKWCSLSHYPKARGRYLWPILSLYFHVFKSIQWWEKLPFLGRSTQLVWMQTQQGIYNWSALMKALKILPVKIDIREYALRNRLTAFALDLTMVFCRSEVSTSALLCLSGKRCHPENTHWRLCCWNKQVKIWEPAAAEGSCRGQSKTGAPSAGVPGWTWGHRSADARGRVWGQG